MGDVNKHIHKRFRTSDNETSTSNNTIDVEMNGSGDLDTDSNTLILSNNADSDVCVLSNDEEDVLVISDDDDSSVRLKDKEVRSQCIDKLFPSTSTDKPKEVAFKKPAVNRMIEGVNVAFPVEPYGCQVALMSKIIIAIKRGENCILESPTGTGKTLALLCGALAWQQREKEIINKRISEMNEKKRGFFDMEDLDNFFVEVPKIYYGARTHSQLKQVIAEFKRTPYCGGEGGAKMAILSSRDQACMREYNSVQWTSINDMCQKCIKPNKDGSGSNCKYYDNREAVAKLFKSRDAFDLEELKDAGKQTVSCPYYAARSLSKQAEIIFCPYNYLIDSSIKERLEIKLKGNIVIVDEAHNIEGTCRDTQTHTIEWAHVDKAYEELEKASKYYSKLTYLEGTLRSWKQWFLNHSKLDKNAGFEKNWKAEHFIESLNNHNIGRSQLTELLDNVRDLDRMYQNSPESLYGVTDVTVQLFGTIGRALRDTFEHQTEYKPKLICENGYLKSLKLECLNPALAMEQLSDARCIALASGTLSPMDSLYSELGTAFRHKVSLNHVIPRNRVWIGTLARDAVGQRLQCTKDKLCEPGHMDTLGRAVLNVCRVTPHGVLCVLPSYRALNNIRQRWESQGIMGELKNEKYVYIESKKDHDSLMKQYFSQVESEKGALLLAVHRGKVSEGIDFKDNQARCVICIGIPYPNFGDAEAKMDYNEKYCKERNLLTGRTWYHIQAFRTLNQAVGRCVRHAGDWGAVLLVDARFEEPSNRARLACWVRNYMDTQSHSVQSLFSDEDRSLKSFMGRFKENKTEA